MSADNGVYIAEFPTPSGEKEWRVAHCQNIEDCWEPELGEAYLVIKFGESKVHTNYSEAEQEAMEIAEEILSDDMCPILEYGIQELDPFHRPFPTMTLAEADRAIDQFFSDGIELEP